MLTQRVLSCLGMLALSPLLLAQSAPTAYSIVEAPPGFSHPATMVLSRSGSMVLMDVTQAPDTGSTSLQRTFTLYDLNAGVTHTWQPAADGGQPTCSIGKFSGDWGDPFAMTAELSGEIAKGNLKPTGAETIDGIATKIYAGDQPQGRLKVWFDEKDGLVLRAQFGPPGDSPMQTMVDIKRVWLTQPAASLFVLPASCASLKPAPTPAELLAEETGDNGDNFVNGMYGPGSKNSCTVILRVVRAGTMTPVTTGLQIAIDTNFDVDNPPHYTFGVHTDGSQDYSGGAVRDISSQIRNGIVRIDNPPPYFNLSVNIKKPGSGAGMGLVYRQCFGPQTVLLDVVNNLGQQGQSSDFLWVKSGKYATVSAAH